MIFRLSREEADFGCTKASAGEEESVLNPPLYLKEKEDISGRASDVEEDEVEV